MIIIILFSRTSCVLVPGRAVSNMGARVRAVAAKLEFYS